MSTDRQIAANKKNARKSTGPRTPTGKARVSSNALKHGLTGKDIVLPDESAVEFESYRKDLLASLTPQGDLEFMLADKFVADAWRLRRVPKLEAAIYRRSHEEQIVEKAHGAVRQYERTFMDRISLSETEVEPSDRQAHEDAQKRAKDAQSSMTLLWMSLECC
jgi:hypothetical protein